MQDNYVTFKKYPDAVQARDVEKLLRANDIQCLFVDNASSFDSNFGLSSSIDYEIQLLPVDFEKANALLHAQAGEWIEDLPNDYYLLSFTDDELTEVIYKKDEWSDFDYVLAKKILAERGKPIDEALEKELWRDRLDKMAQPEKTGMGSGGFLASYVIYNAKKTLPDGRSVYTYSKNDRQKASFRIVISVVAIIVFFLIMLWKLLK